MSINWRERFIAAVIHFLITAAVAGLAAAIIFFVWFPGSLASMIGGAKLFLLVIGCDVILGPLISLVIYSSKKSRKQLIADYCVVGLVQLAALAYGVHVVALSRPVFIVFDVDRLQIVTAIELDDADLAAGNAAEFRSKSWTGPRLASISRPTDVKERNDLLFAEVGGKLAPLTPKYYGPYTAAREAINQKSQPVQALAAKKQNRKDEINQAVKETEISESELNWLLVRHRFGFAVALIDKRSGLPVKYVLIDPT
jgi:hypothetical protein